MLEIQRKINDNVNNLFETKSKTKICERHFFYNL